MIGERIKSEREKLGFNQVDFAELAGAKRRTLIDWEKGSTAPNAFQLEMMSKQGVDIGYVVTGNRSVNTKRVAEIVELIESLLVEHGRHVSPKGKARIIAGLLELEQESQQEVKASNVLPFVTAAGF